MTGKRSNYILSSKIVVIILMIAGFFLTIWGLNRLSWLGAIGWYPGGAVRVSIFFLASLLSIAGLSHWSRLNPIAIGCFVSSLLAVLANSLWPLIVTFWFVFSSTILGNRILYAFQNGKHTTYNNLATFFLVGASIYGTIIGLLIQFPVNYPGVYATILAAPLIIFRSLSIQLLHAMQVWITTRSSNNSSKNLIDIFIATVAMVYAVVALMPEVGFDALATHLFIPAQLAANHQWGFDVSMYVWAVMPYLGDCIFSIGYLLAGETAARLISVIFIFVLCWLIRELVIWSGGKDSGAKWAVLIFLSTPLTFTEGSSLYVEAIWASYLVGGTLAVLRFCSASCDAKIEIPAAGILLGCAVSTKMPALVVFPVLLLLMVYHYKAWLRSELHRALTYAFILLICFGSIPYIRSYWITGNPVFPFFNQLFQSSQFPAVNFNNPIYNSGLSWDTIYRIAFESGNYLESAPGASGYQWLIFLVPALIVSLVNRRWRNIEVATVGILAIAIIFQLQSYLRYIFPSFVLLTAVLGMFLSDLMSGSAGERKFICISTGIIVGLNLISLNAGAFYRDFPLESLPGESARKAYLHERLPIRNAIALANELNTRRAPVAVFAHPLTAGLEADALYPNWYNKEFLDLIKEASTEAAIAEVLIGQNVDIVILDDSWGATDKRLLIKKATDEIHKIGSISVRGIHKEHLFKTELLKNPDFAASKGWVLSKDAEITPGVGMVASQSSIISQVVPVTPERRYLNTVTVRCVDTVTQGRMQVNWLDSNSQIVKTDIRVFDCSTNSK
jgi:hypothetical protein